MGGSNPYCLPPLTANQCTATPHVRLGPRGVFTITGSKVGDLPLAVTSEDTHPKVESHHPAPRQVGRPEVERGEVGQSVSTLVREMGKFSWQRRQQEGRGRRCRQTHTSTWSRLQGLMLFSRVICEQLTHFHCSDRAG